MELDVVSVQLVREKILSDVAEVISSTADAGGLFQRLMNRLDREVMALLTMDSQNRPINISVVSMGTLNSSLIHPREVFKTVILSNAAKFIIAHNHPSGDVVPSAEDVKITKRLQEAGKLMGVDMIDHIIVGHGEYYSFQENETCGIGCEKTSVAESRNSKTDMLAEYFDAAVKRHLEMRKNTKIKSDEDYVR